MQKWKHMMGEISVKNSSFQQNSCSRQDNCKDSYQKKKSKYTPRRSNQSAEYREQQKDLNAFNLNISQPKYIKRSPSFASNKSKRSSIDSNTQFSNQSLRQSLHFQDWNPNFIHAQSLVPSLSTQRRIMTQRKMQKQIRMHKDSQSLKISEPDTPLLPTKNKQQIQLLMDSLGNTKKKLKILKSQYESIKNEIKIDLQTYKIQYQKMMRGIASNYAKNGNNNLMKGVGQQYGIYNSKINRLDNQKKVLLESLHKL